jgi:hypothetical protein
MNIRRFSILTAGVIAAIIAFVLVAGIIIYLIFLLPPVQRYTLEIAQNKINSSISGKVKAGNIRTNLFSFVELNNIMATLPDRPCDSIFVKHLTVHFQLLALISHTIHISAIDINEIDAMISIPHDGKLKIPLIPRKTAKPNKKQNVSATKWKFIIESVRLRKIQATYSDKNSNFTGHIKDGLIDGRLTNHYVLPVSITVPQGYFTSPWWSGNIERIESSVLITKDFLNIKELIVESPGTSCRGSGQIPFVKNGIWDLSVSVKSSLEPLVILREFSPLSQCGLLNADMSWKGTFRRPLLFLDFRGKGLRLYNVNIDSLKLTGKYSEDALKASMSVFSHAAQVYGKMSAKIDKFFTLFDLKDYSSSFQISLSDLSYLHKRLPQLNFSGHEKTTLSLSADGNGFNFPYEITFQSNTERLSGEPVYIAGSLKTSQWNFSGDWGKNNFKGTGFIYNFHKIDGSINAIINEPSVISMLFIGQRTSGSLNATADLSGTISDPSILLNINIDKLQWRDVAAEKVVSKLSFNNKKTFIENAEGKLSGALDSVLNYFGIDSSGGNFSADFKASGPTSGLSARVNLGGTDFYYKKLRFDSLKGTLLKDADGKVTWQRTEITKNNSKIESEGTFKIGKTPVFGSFFKINKKDKNHWKDGGLGRIDGKISGENIDAVFSTVSLDLSSISSILALQDTINGALSSKGNLGGSIHNPQIGAHINIVNPGYETFTLGKMDGDIFLKDSLFIMNDSKIALTDSSTFNVSVRYPMIPSKGWQIDTFGTKKAIITIRSDSFDLRGLKSLLGNRVRANGPCSINLVLANSEGPWRVNGKVAVTGGHIAYLPMSIEAEIIKFNSTFGGTIKYPEATFGLSTGISRIRSAKIDSSVFEGTLKGDTLHLVRGYASFENGGELKVKGTVPLVNFDSLFTSADPGLEFEMTRIPLSLLESFIPDFHVKSGTLAGNGKIIIHNGKLCSQGNLHLDKGILSFDWLDSDIGPLNGDFSLRGDSLIINSLKGKMGKGKIEATGNTAILQGGFFHIDIAAKGSDITLQMTDLINLNIRTMSVRLTDEGKGYLIEGNMFLGPTTFVRDIRINDLLEMSKEKNSFLRQNDPLNKWVLKIDVGLQQNFFINMNLGNLQLDGNIAVSGTAASPQYLGEIKVVQGYLNYLDRQFEISKGLLIFDNPFVLNPIFEISASSDVFAYAPGSIQPITYMINLSLTGNLEHPVILLSSVPQLSEPDILSVLTLGTTLNAVGSDVASRIGSLVGQELLGLGARRLGKILGLESLSISGGLIGSGSGPSVTLTKSISQRIIVTYQTGITNLNQQRFSAILRLFPFLYLVGGTDQSGNADIKLNYRIYR